jgi:hypothetical protein
MGNDSLAEVSKPLISKAAKGEAEDGPPAKTVLEFKDIGVWTIMNEVQVGASWTLPGRAVLQQGRYMMAILPIGYHFVYECFSVAPWMMLVYLLASVWYSTEVSISIVRQQCYRRLIYAANIGCGRPVLFKSIIKYCASLFIGPITTSLTSSERSKAV